MSAAAQNYELITLELHAHLRELTPDIRLRFDTLFNRVREDLTQEKDLVDSCDNLIESIFELRIKALIWLTEQNQLNLLQNMRDAEKLTAELALDNRLDVLSENLGFALRTMRRVMQGIVDKVAEEGINLQEHGKSVIPDIDYWAYFDLLDMTMPNKDLLLKMMEWVDSSLELEYAILAAILLNEEKLNVSQTTIDNLAVLIALAAQDYGAYSVELGIVPMQVAKAHKEYPIPDESDFIKDQQLLADSGLEDLGPDLDKQ